jgi:hypothetical protein
MADSQQLGHAGVVPRHCSGSIHALRGKAISLRGKAISYTADHERATVITSNLGLTQLAEHDAHMADRLSEGLVLRLSGESRRGLGVETGAWRANMGHA